MSPTGTVIIAGLMAAALPDAVDAQCAMCRTLLATPEGQQLVVGFQRGILLLLVAPFTIFGVVAVLAVRSHRRVTRATLDTPSTQG